MNISSNPDQHTIPTEPTRGSVLITGASTGIGKSCALHLIDIGFNVFAGVRKKSDAEQLKQESAGRICPLFIDVTDMDSIGKAEQFVADKVGARGLHGLVNNAGIVVAGPLENLPIAEIRKQFEINLFGQIAVTQAFLPLIRKARGRIVNMGSISGRMASPIIGPYSASKYALEAFTDALRVELNPWNIQVSIIEPGVIATPIWKKSIDAAENIGEEYQEEALSLYGPLLTAARAFSERANEHGISPDVVAKAVAHALTAKTPRTRYLVGGKARIEAFLKKYLPDRVFDRLIMRSLGLSKKPPS